MKKYESGRSMVEMLGVLAIMGILSIGCIAGYNYGINKYRANTIINDIMLRATDAIAQFDATGNANLSEWPTITAGKYTIGLEDETIGIQVDGLPAQLCEMVYNAIKDKADVKLNGTILESTNDNIACNNINTMVFYVDNTIDIARGEQTTPPTECTTHDDCKAEGVCMGCIIEDGQETGHCEYACQELEYLESDGNQYINLGIIPNDKIGVKAKFYVNSASGKNYVVGSRGNSVGRFYLYSTEGSAYVRYGWGAFYTTNITPVVGTPVEASLNYLNDRKYIYNGTEVNSNLPQTDFSGNTYVMYLSSSNFANVFYNDAILKGRIYYCQITQGDKVIMDLIPVLEPEGVPAMLDQVEEKLYYNQGSGQFTYSK